MTAVVTSFARKIELAGNLDSDTTYHFEWISTSPTVNDTIVRVMKERIAQDIEGVRFHGFENINFKTLKKLVCQSKNRFRVVLESIPCTNRYRVHLHYSPPKTILSISYIHELIEFFRDSVDSLKKEILKTMVKIFISTPELMPYQVQEIIAVIRFLGHADVKQVLRKLVFLCNKNHDYFELLTEALSHIKRNNSEFNWSQVEKTDPLPTHFLEMDECLELISLFYAHLCEADTKQSVYYLRALVILQELTKNLENFSKSSDSPLHEDCNNKIRKFRHAEGLSARFLAAYSLEHAQLDEKTKKVNHALLLSFAEESNPRKQGPWKYLVQRASRTMDRPMAKTLERLWQELILIQSTYTLNRQSFLLDFHKFISDALSENKETATQFEKALNTGHDDYFIEGCIELGRCLIDLHAYDSIDVVTDAMNLLLKIRSDNLVPQDSTLCHFRVHKHLKNLPNYIDERVCAILNHCTQSPNPPTVLAAKRSLSKLQGNKLPDSVSLTDFPRCQLFERSLRSLAPHISGLREMKTQLESDAQLKIFQENSTDPLVFSTNGEPINLNEFISNFFKNKQNKAVFLFGESKKINSLVIQILALKYLRNFQSSEVIPLYTSLEELINPQKKFVEESLKKYGMLDSMQLLQKRRVIWFVDGFDAAFKEKANFNFYNTNSLETWDAQFVFTYANKKLKSCFNPNLRIRVIGEREPMNIAELDVPSSEEAAPLTI